jgi:predicted DsbA family dithiol-disulfide isomerase
LVLVVTSSAQLASASAPAPLVVEVWSDVVCPWCYIGKRRLEAALAGFEHRDQVEVVWRSFELDPTTPHSGEPGAGADLAAYLGAKYGGGRDNGLAMNARVSEVAATDGLDYRLDQAVRANTIDAHRLLHLALETGGPELQGRLKERLLAGYFTGGEVMDDHATLRAIAAEVGLDQARVDEVLAGSDYTDDVAADIDQARAYGANGVPFTVVDGRYGVSGAQPVEVFEQALERAWADRAPQLEVLSPSRATGAEAVAPDGAVCGPDGCELPPA